MVLRQKSDLWLPRFRDFDLFLILLLPQRASLKRASKGSRPNLYAYVLLLPQRASIKRASKAAD
jgi:hypothetical protein